ncbi:MAG: hypothetical protein J0L70_23080 [Leptolyngbya sp. UWPOB_LEPTO1]|uniref:IS1/IS1595 family N-terminal zinc-binding domain-containing protein n=1 Tax=Leptolyngbya sp. UWPOB_LEPTO1 TaxID=2815653 RepID=UPI001ACFF660|nr:hypothetical protein [Leptolyngbya sp. UWPOB_LEPTO1]MBN8563424.1 hypothetical protein [Leptolyngbya sp. UWPOB_LEPTO1]
MSQEKTVMVGTRVSTNIEQRIKQLAEKMGITPARLIGNAIALYLGDEVAPSPVDQLSELEQTVSALNRRISNLAQPLEIDEQLTALKRELADMRSRIDKISAPVIRPRCPECNWHQPRKNGTRSDGSQQWICNRCGRSWHQELVLHTINQN